MEADIKEPQYFRGDGSDSYSVQEWEELMERYLEKKRIPIEERAQEITSKLLGKARDIVKVTLRSNPLLRPGENPKVIVDVLK